MNEPLANIWNERYSNKAFAYGETPNLFLAEILPQFQAGTALFPAEGEGRNAVYAAQKGWKATAFDISEEGKKKAMQLAQKNNVTIHYELGSLHTLAFESASFDAIICIYAHFPPHLKAEYYSMFDRFLKPGGIVIFEAFSKKHLEYNSINERVGGPKDADSLFSIDEVKSYFPPYDAIILEEKTIELKEGLYHNGQGSVIRFVGRKPF